MRNDCGQAGGRTDRQTEGRLGKVPLLDREPHTGQEYPANCSVNAYQSLFTFYETKRSKVYTYKKKSQNLTENIPGFLHRLRSPVVHLFLWFPGLAAFSWQEKYFSRTCIKFCDFFALSVGKKKCSEIFAGRKKRRSMLTSLLIN